MPKEMETIAELIKRREGLVKCLDRRGISDATQEQLFADIEALNWKIANSLARDIRGALCKAKLLVEVSGTVYLHTIEGVLLKSLIDDLENLSS